MALAPHSPQSAPTRHHTDKNNIILSAAHRLFLAHGYNDTHMDSVADEAGVSKQTVYSHFGSKKALFLAVINAQCALMTLEENVSFPNHIPATPLAMRSTIQHIAHHIYTTLMHPQTRQLWRIVITQAPDTPELSNAFLTHGPEHLFNKLTTFFDEQNSAGTLNIPNPRKAAEHFFSLLCDYHHLKALLSPHYVVSEHTQEEHLEDVTDLFMRLYGPLAPRAVSS